MCQHHKNLDWKRYIDDEVDDRDQYEQALGLCPDCLQDYIQALDADLAAPSPGFTKSIMAKVLRSGRFTALKPVLHFLVAACLTLVLLEVGAFDWMFSSSDLAESPLLSEILSYLENVFGLLKTNLGGM